MRKVVVTEYISLDGIMEDPGGWTGPYWNDELGEFQFDGLSASDALLMGRVTYQEFAASWPTRTTADDLLADQMNSYPKYVVSTTLKAPLEWSNSHLIKENVAEAISNLKQQPGQNIMTYGTRALVHTLMEHHLIDEYRLIVYPVVLGSGKRLFSDGINTTLKLVDTKPFSSGVVALTYQPAQSE